MATNLDHVSFATTNALETASLLRERYGATAVFGETLPEFRYLLLFLGTPEHGGFLELLDPNNSGFLSRFLDKHGPGPHHITFIVDDLKASATHARDLGFTVTGENYEHESWREAFIAPHPATGCVIQLAQTPHRYPPPEELLANNDRDVDSYPSSQGALDNTWWLPIWETEPGPGIQWLSIATSSSNAAALTALYRDVLGADVSYNDHVTACTWPGGSITIERANRSGIDGVLIADPSRSQRTWLNLPAVGARSSIKVSENIL